MIMTTKQRGCFWCWQWLEWWWWSGLCRWEWWWRWWLQKIFVHRFLLLGQRVHSAFSSTILTLARPVQRYNNNYHDDEDKMICCAQNIHLLLMEKSLDSLEPPASESFPRDEVVSPARVLRPSSSPEGRIGEVWAEEGSIYCSSRGWLMITHWVITKNCARSD